MKPVISIIVRTYNRARLLSRALNSIAAQTFKNFELIIVDDASTDQTSELLKCVIAEFESMKIVRRLRNSHQEPREEPMNDGLAIAQGDLIAHLDDDNLWHPQFLEILCEPFIENDSIQLCYCDTCDHFGASDLSAIAADGRSRSHFNKRSVVFPHTGQFNGINLEANQTSYSDYLDTNEIMYRRSAINAIGGKWPIFHPHYHLINLIQGDACSYRVHNDLAIVESIIGTFGSTALRYIPRVLTHFLERSSSFYDNPFLTVTELEAAAQISSLEYLVDQSFRTSTVNEDRK